MYTFDAMPDVVGPIKRAICLDMVSSGMIHKPHRPQAIANILSLSNVQLRYRVEYGGEIGSRFVVNLKSGTKKVFEMSDAGLHYLDAAAERARSRSEATVLIQAVKDN